MSTALSTRGLLPFHLSILEELHDPLTSDLLLLARGLGLRRIVCALMQIYESPKNLVLLVNASPEEEAAIGEELGIMGCRKPGLRVVGYEMPKKDRQDLYKKGGLISVTSRILVVDILQSDIPTELITGILVLHAEKVNALSLEAFIVRLYREKNKTGFLKAFSDQPEHITSGLSPLKNIMKELQLRAVHIYPRFHEKVKEALEKKRADVVELHQPMTDLMKDIHGAIVQCMNTTLSELKRSNTTLDLDELNVENAYFRSFDAIVRRQLDPVWHKVGPRTKQLVSDLATLRRLLTYLLTYDALAFHAYLETIIASNSVSSSGAARQNHSPWLLTDAAHIIFQSAKRRCYNLSAPVAPPVIDLADDDEAWDALDEAEGRMISKENRADTDAEKRRCPKWLPDGMDPVLEELPKWSLLADVLKEIEEEIMRQESTGSMPNKGTNTVLVMTSSTRTSTVLTEFLTSMDTDAQAGTQGRKMMEDKLRLYFWWKAKLSEDGKSRTFERPPDKGSNNPPNEISEALKKKDKDRRERVASRRRVRGGAAGAAASAESGRSRGTADRVGMTLGEEVMRDEAENIAEFLATQSAPAAATHGAAISGGNTLTAFDEDLALALTLSENTTAFESEFEEFYGLLPPQQTVIMRAYSDDSDDRMLAESQPRFIVMFEPNQDFVRRIEVYRSSNPGLGVRVYFMLYQTSCEEHKYLAGLRREKEAFERLIKERGTMLMPIIEDHRAGTEAGEAMIKTISSRMAGGRREVSTEPSRVIVDMREFRSTLPSLLHASKLLVVPATLTVGDYILTPDICVERKSIPDLVSSFNSGRLYTQCELMSVHYKQPVLLIEFEENKSFSLEIVQDVKAYAKPTSKYPSKNKPAGSEPTAAPSVQAKLVLLTLTFPRVRVIWSSSPYATADIFNDLKANAPEPDYHVAVVVGADRDPQQSAGGDGEGDDAAAEELLRSLPGITDKNLAYVKRRVGSVRGLCDMGLEEVKEILGDEPGKRCWDFLHWGEAKGKGKEKA
ncbi:hypothetical protein EW146_g6966 [Bondarzewia mesenterica]|uniref:ERCC4 domain-containing protein n=1 Tax=Bondarzewia mesenterica TaxID=1095465 RepID=A0A4S4LM23_9AGAM|nr:hypothetical protein EW146_g6966 [Bondarzewia mesenterica]